MNEVFSGFGATALTFLRELPKRDTRWFKENRKIYETLIANPAKTFVVAMGSELSREVSKSITAVPRANGSISPINNDVRFANNKSAYKDHLLFRFWQGPTKQTAPTMFIRISPTEVGFASGTAFSDTHQWREAVANDSGNELDILIGRLKKKHPIDIVGAALKKVPSPYAADHPRGDLLKHKMFQVRWAEALPTSIDSARFVPWCGHRLKELAAIHQWQVNHL